MFEVPQLLHLDADAFFASVEQAADKRLRGIAMAVGGGRRGVITSASYEARACGIRAAMPTRRALRLWPDLVVVSGNYELYEAFSGHIFGLCRELTPSVERTSIDEGYLDFSGRFGGDTVVNAARTLDREITDWLKITVSQGLASNKLVASVAGKLRKPHGFVVVPPGSESAFMASLPVGRLPGIGPKSRAALSGIGVRTIGDLRRLGPEGLRPFLGRPTGRILEAAAGIDKRPVESIRREAESYGCRHTFPRDEGNEGRVKRTLKAMIDALMVRLRAAGKQARTITLRIRYADREEKTASRGLFEPSDLESEFYPLVPLLLSAAWTRRVHLRLVGVRFTNLYAAREQIDLFDNRRTRRRHLARTVDRLNRAHGKTLLSRACHLEDGKPGFHLTEVKVEG